MAWSKPDRKVHPHPENVEGPFYVENNCCLLCGMPGSEAPDLFKWASDEKSCVVKRQPQTAEELDRMMLAVYVAEMDCIRYRGTDPAIQRRIAAMGSLHALDHEPPADARWIIRSHATFKGKTNVAGPSTAFDIARAFAAHMRLAKDGERYRVWSPGRLLRWPVVRLSIGRGLYVLAVRFRRQRKEQGWVAVAQAPMEHLVQEVSYLVDDWLKHTDMFADIRWFTAEEWKAGAAGHLRVRPDP